jgi:hypothetical protein
VVDIFDRGDSKPPLALVFLNGCNTKELGLALLGVGVQVRGSLQRLSDGAVTALWWLSQRLLRVGMPVRGSDGSLAAP